MDGRSPMRSMHRRKGCCWSALALRAILAAIIFENADAVGSTRLRLEAVGRFPRPAFDLASGLPHHLASAPGASVVRKRPCPKVACAIPAARAITIRRALRYAVPVDHVTSPAEVARGGAVGLRRDDARSIDRRALVVECAVLGLSTRRVVDDARALVEHALALPEARHRPLTAVGAQ